MTEPIQIGLRDVYDSVVGLDKKFDAFAAEHDKKLALIDQRVGVLERVGDASRAARLKTNLALFSAGVAVASSVVVPLMVR